MNARCSGHKNLANGRIREAHRSLAYGSADPLDAIVIFLIAPHFCSPLFFSIQTVVLAPKRCTCIKCPVENVSVTI